jgi:hypothetical protein
VDGRLKTPLYLRISPYISVYLRISPYIFLSLPISPYASQVACRLKISVVMIDAPLELPWDLSGEMAAYLFRIEHVCADCLLTPEEVTLTLTLTLTLLTPEEALLARLMNQAPPRR